MSAAPTYRPEIDGLRALAVLPVIFYHAGLPGFGGGFVGVDVFFVISGYLITRLILAEIAEGRFSLWRFYERRARRIWPALFLVLFVTAPFACFILFPHALVDFGESYLATALSLSNVHFYLESGYFSDAAALKPLLHTWSLGVEEQYYLLAPFLALLLCRLSWRALLLGTLLLIAVSFGWLLSSPSLDATFFLPMSRVWELQLGALLAVLEQKRARALHPALSPLGLAMIAAAVVLLDENLPYPSTLTLLPTLGTALVIAGGSAYVSLLAHRWLVAIGLISYSAYLWHQPLFALTRAALRAEPAPLVTAGLIAATFLLAWGSWRFVERPFRSQAILRARFWRLAAIALLAQIALGALLLSGLLSPDRGPFSSEQIAAEKTLRGTKMKELCDAKGWAVCDQPAGSARHGLIIGDSHAVDGLNALAAIFPQDDFSISLLGGCPPHPALDRLVPARHPDLADCLSLNQKRFDPAWLAQFDYVAISVLFDWFKPSDLAPFLAALKAAGIERVLIFGDGFVLSADLPEIINRYGFDCPVIESYVQGTAGRFDETLAQMAAEGGFLFISKKAALCPKGNGCLCELIEGALISWDRNHLSFAAASRLLLGMTEEVTRYLAE